MESIVPNSFPALFYGYSALWLLLGLYLVSLGVRICKLERELRERREGD